MQSKFKFRQSALALTIVAALSSGLGGFVGEAVARERVGTVDAIWGQATLSNNLGSSIPITLGLDIYEGQTVTSQGKGEVHIVTEDGGVIAIRPNTIFRVDGYQAKGKSSDKILMSLLRGTIRSITGWIGKFNPSAYHLRTASATIVIRGTDHETTVVDLGHDDEAGTYDFVHEGETVLTTSKGSVLVAPGGMAFAPQNLQRPPFSLAHPPRFLAQRHLRIEERIQQRKMDFKNRLDQMRDQRGQQLHRQGSVKPSFSDRSQPPGGSWSGGAPGGDMPGGGVSGGGFGGGF